MKLLFLTANLLGLALGTLKTVVPEVKSVMSSMTASFAPAVTYAGPTGSASVELKTSKSKKTSASAIPTQSPAPYWLEQIKHQGISAFNPTPESYQVFRNVKDFGATGELFQSVF
jgi:glucan 1,3-beta-glucosidase